MAQRKPEEPKGGAPEYMTTYGGLVTLLLCFFVLLYAMSNVDVEKFQAVAASFGSGPPAPLTSGSKDTLKELLGSGIMQMPGSMESSEVDVEAYKKAQDELAKMASDFKTYLAENNMQDKVQVELKSDHVLLNFPDGVLFDPGKAVLREQAVLILGGIGDTLIRYPESDIQIDGHTDTDPIYTTQYPSNWHLSAARAITVGLYLQDEKDLNPASVLAVGRGEYMPIAPNDTSENKAKNRRVEIKIKNRFYTDNDI